MNSSVSFDFNQIEELKSRYDMREIYPEYRRRRYPHYDLDQCIFHEDHRPSMFIFANGYRCKGCSASGDIITFIQQMEGGSFVEVVQMLADGLPKINIRRTYQVIPPSPPPVYTQEPKILAEGMLESDYKELEFKTCINRVTAELHKIGRFNPGVFSIPIQNPDDNSEIVDVKLYRPKAPANTVKTWHLKSGAHNYLYGVHFLNGDNFAVIKGGEKDTILGHQVHLPFVTTTSGEGSWDEKMNKYLSERRWLYSWLDADSAGRSATMRIRRVNRRVIACDWAVLYDSCVPKGFDFHDYIAEGGTAELFREMLENARKGLFGGRIKPVIG
jgi:hypothetical protein